MSKQTPKPGVYYGMPIDEYHGYGEAISKSGLDDMARSPAIYKALRSPGAPARVEKASQLHGNLAHCAILEPAEFDKRYAVGPSVNRNTKEWKQFVESTLLTPIQQEQRDAAFSQAASVMALTDVYEGMTGAEFFAQGDPEVSNFWIDRETGVLCRCRPDWRRPVGLKRVVLGDVKTVGDATRREFERQVARMNYQTQDSFYTDGDTSASGDKVEDFIFIVVEPTWPYAAASYRLDDESRHEGYIQYRGLLDSYAMCKRTGVWRGIASSTQTISLPAYAKTNSEEIEITYAS